MKHLDKDCQNVLVLRKFSGFWSNHDRKIDAKVLALLSNIANLPINSQRFKTFTEFKEIEEPFEKKSNRFICDGLQT